MRYAVLNLVVAAVVLVVVRIFTRTKPDSRFLVSLAIVLGMTAVFDSLIIASGIVGYNHSTLLGWYIGRAPIEDFAYAVVAVILTATLWEYFDED